MSDVTANRRLEDELVRRERILRAVADSAARLLRAASWEDEAPGLVAALGEAAQVSRTYIFRFDAGPGGKLLTSQLHEWVAPSISPQIANPDLQGLDMQAVGLGGWAEALTRGELVQRHAEGMSDAERALLAPQDILSIVVVPVMVAGQAWGFLGFDECARRRDWTAAELDALRSAAGILGGTIARERSEARQREQQEVISNLAESVSAKTGAAFFNSLVEHLAKTLRVSCALICELDRDSQDMHTLAAYTDRGGEGPGACPPRSRPCGEVIEEGVLVIPEKLADRFPSLCDNCEPRAESYVGLAIRSSRDETLGVIAIYDSKPMRDTALAVTTARIFAARAGAEIERQASERALRESEEQFRQLAENIDEVFWLFDPHEDHYIYVSPYYETVCGGSRRDLSRDPRVWLLLVHEEDRERMQRFIEGVRCGKALEDEFRIIHPEHGERWIRSRSFPIRDARGQIVRVAGIVDDITDHRRAEQARLEREREQREALVREVHHRIKNHLQGVTGLLERQASAEPEIREHLRAAAEQVEVIASVHGLLGSGANDVLAPEVLAENIGSSIRGIYGRGLEVDIQPVVIGRYSIAQAAAVPIALILNELVSNAMKHGADVPVEMRLQAMAGCLAFVVRNTATDWPADLDFESGRGLGSGLSLVRSLLPRNGASLTFAVDDDRRVSAVLTMEPPVIRVRSAGRKAG